MLLCVLFKNVSLLLLSNYKVTSDAWQSVVIHLRGTSAQRVGLGNSQIQSNNNNKVNFRQDVHIYIYIKYNKKIEKYNTI